MRRVKYNHHIETDADFAVIDDADSCRWYEYIAPPLTERNSLRKLINAWCEASNIAHSES